MKQAEETNPQKPADGLPVTDPKAFDELFRGMYPRLVRFAFKITRDWNASCDITQNVFVMLWQNRTNIDPGLSVRAYLYRSVRNRSYNYLRDRRDVADPDSIIAMTDESFPADANVSDDGQDAILKLKLQEWVGALPKRQREAFEMSRFEGLFHHEIAGVMGVSTKTVNNHLSAALKQLRLCYEEFRKASKDK